MDIVKNVRDAVVLTIVTFHDDITGLRTNQRRLTP